MSDTPRPVLPITKPQRPTRANTDNTRQLTSVPEIMLVPPPRGTHTNKPLTKAASLGTRSDFAGRLGLPKPVTNVTLKRLKSPITNGTPRGSFLLKQPAYIPDMELVHQMHQFESEYSELVLDETRPFRFLASRPKDLKHSELATKITQFDPPSLQPRFAAFKDWCQEMEGALLAKSANKRLNETPFREMPQGKSASKEMPNVLASYMLGGSRSGMSLMSQQQQPSTSRPSSSALHYQFSHRRILSQDSLPRVISPGTNPASSQTPPPIPQTTVT